MKNPKVGIIILNWNGKKDTLECFESLKKISYPNVEIILVDNGSTDDSVETFKRQYPDLTYIETHKNLGFAGGNNVGLKYALSKDIEYMFLLNNDTIVDPNFVEPFIEAMQKHPNAGVLGAKILSYFEPDTVDHLGGFWNPKKGEFDSFAKDEKDSPDFSMQKVDYVCGCALFAKREVLEKVGFLESRFFLLWEETDFCFRAARAGFEIWTVPEAKIWHKVSASFVGGKPHMHYFWWRSRLLWIERNCSFRTGCKLYFQIIFPELFKQLRHFILKNLQMIVTSKKNRAPKKEKICRYQAGLCGARDYLLRRFGNCPSWLLQKRK